MSNIQSDRSQPDEPIRHHHDSDSVSITFIGTIGLRKQIAGIAALKNKSASAFMRDVLQNAVDGVPAESVTDCNALKKEMDAARDELEAVKKALKSAEAERDAAISERDAADAVLLAAQSVQLAASEPVSVTVEEPGKAVDVPLNINVRLRVTIEKE